MCDCNGPKVEHRLCYHAIAALVHLQQPVQNHVYTEDKASTWRGQYDFDCECKVPTIRFASELPEVCPYKVPIAFSANKGSKAKRGLSSRDIMFKEALKKKRKELNQQRPEPPPTPPESPVPRPPRKARKAKATAPAPAPQPRRSPRRGRGK